MNEDSWYDESDMRIDVGENPVRVKAFQYGFGSGEERLIEVPRADWDATASLSGRLELVFKFGQNDFQPRPARYSLSVGDVVDIGEGEFYLVKSRDWMPLTKEQVEEWSQVPRDRRSLLHEWLR